MEQGGSHVCTPPDGSGARGYTTASLQPPYRGRLRTRDQALYPVQHKRHADELAEGEVTTFLTHLAVDRKVSASTQNQALSAILFLYKQVLDRKLEWLGDVVRAKRPKRLPVVLSRAEVNQLLSMLDGSAALIAQLMYGTGLRLMEALRLRVKDVDFEYRQILVRTGKGDKDRVTVLPDTLIERLRAHLEKVRALHQADLNEGFGRVYLPSALARKYPNANREWAWHYVFPSRNRSCDPRSGEVRRHHLDEKNLQRSIRHAALRCGFHKPVSSPTLRHCFASLLLVGGYDIRSVQVLLGHKDVKPPMIYTHVTRRGGRGVRDRKSVV